MGNDPLAELKPLIQPATISNWQMAPGWWVLGALLFIALIVLIIKSWKYWQHYRGTRYQREAQQLLASVNHLENEKQLQEIALILRRVAVCAWGRDQVSTKNWREIINISASPSSKKGKPAFDEASIQLLTDSLYKKESPSPEAIKLLLAQAAVWLKSLPPVKR